MTAPLVFLAVLVAGFLVVLLAMVYVPRIRRRVRAWRQGRIAEEQAADRACARLRNVEGGRRA